MLICITNTTPSDWRSAPKTLIETLYSVGTKCHSNSSESRWDIVVWTKATSQANKTTASGFSFNKVKSVIHCNMHGVFGHFLRNICSHYNITASECTLWEINSLSRTNSLKVDEVQHWIKSDMTVIRRQKTRNKIVLSCKYHYCRGLSTCPSWYWNQNIF